MMRKYAIWGFVLAAAAVIGVGWASKREIDRLASGFEAELRSYQAMAQSGRIRSLARAGAREELLRAFEQLRLTLSDDANQQRRLNRLGRMIDSLAGAHAQTTDVAESVFVLLDEIEIEEQNKLTRRSGDAARTASGAFRALSVGAGVTLATIAWSCVFAYRHVRAARHAEMSLAELQQNTESILSVAGQGVCHFDAAGRIVYANTAAEHLLGYEPGELVGRKGHELLHHSRADGSPYPVEDCPIRGTMETGKVQRIKGEVYWRKDGAALPVEYVCTPIRKAGRITGGLVTFADVSARDRTLHELQKANAHLTRSMDELRRRNIEIQRLGEIAEMLQISRGMSEACRIAASISSDLFPGCSGAICLISASRNIVEVSAQWGAQYNGEAVFAPDTCWALRRGKLHATADPQAVDRCGHTLGSSAPNHLCVPMIAQGDAMGVFHLSSENVAFSEPRRRLAVAASEQVTLALANLRLQETLRQQSIRDPLTGLFNRRYLEESFERELRRTHRRQTPLSVAMMDIDHFKRFNDAFGHEAGDAMLREIGQVLLASVRSEDIVCRYGGEELAVIMPNAAIEDACGRVESIRDLVKRVNVSLQGQSVGGVTISAGVAAYPEHGADWKALLHAADLALYAAKKNGRDRAEVADLAATT